MAALETDHTLQAQGEFTFGVTTGYLVLAHFIGRQLSLGQVALVNTLFIAAQLTFLATTREKVQVISYFESEALKLNPDLPYVTVVIGEGALPFVEITTFIVTLACLAFMWRVRHPKAEQEAS